MIDQIKVYGMRGLDTPDESDELSLAPITLVYGLNSSGKSTVLRSIASLAQAQTESRVTRALDWSLSGSWFEMASPEETVGGGGELRLIYSFPPVIGSDKDMREERGGYSMAEARGVRVALTLEVDSESDEMDSESEAPKLPKLPKLLKLRFVDCELTYPTDGKGDDTLLKMRMSVEERDQRLIGVPDSLIYGDRFVNKLSSESQWHNSGLVEAQRLISEWITSERIKAGASELDLNELFDQLSGAYDDLTEKGEHEPSEPSEAHRLISHRDAAVREGIQSLFEAWRELFKSSFNIEPRLIEEETWSLFKPWRRQFDLTGLLRGDPVSADPYKPSRLPALNAELKRSDPLSSQGGSDHALTASEYESKIEAELKVLIDQLKNLKVEKSDEAVRNSIKARQNLERLINKFAHTAPRTVERDAAPFDELTDWVLDGLNRLSGIGPEKISYLRAHRASTRRYFSLRASSGDTALDLSARRLYYHDKRLKRVNEDLSELFGVEVEFIPPRAHRESEGSSEAEVISMYVKRGEGASHNVADTGYGVSQVIPLLEALQGLKESTLLIEEPEANLHPIAQVKLLERIIHRVKEAQAQANDASISERASSPSRLMVAMETHSEHILQRLLQLTQEGALRDEDIAIIYVERRDSQTVVRKVKTLEGYLQDDLYNHVNNSTRVLI